MHALKHDALGTTRLAGEGAAIRVERDTRSARFGARWLARWLARREARTLRRLADVPGVPRLLAFDGRVVVKTYLAGSPLHECPPTSRRYFARALRILRALHRAGVAHNDLAKEANWIVGPGEAAGLVDFQVATYSARRSARFRALAREDVRHLLKHKRTYCPAALTACQRRLLARPTVGARLWRALAKPVYRLVTRRLLGWPERVGPAERRT